jgi:sterol desaturase/sphingolipid hydroxylase (fatty acid hydroxylase superfamily)
MINYKIFDKKNTEKYFHYQFLYYFIFFIFGILLTKNKSPLITLFVLILISYYIYFIHRIAHNIPNDWNIHTLFHHKNKFNTSYLFNHFMETILNIMFFVSFYWIKLFFKLDFIENSLILYYCIAYTTTHMINYSIFHLGKNHAKHHNIDKNVCNYGPDIMDHIFKTNCDKKFENMNHIIINVLVAYFITSCVYKIPVLS